MPDRRLLGVVFVIALVCRVIPWLAAAPDPARLLSPPDSAEYVAIGHNVAAGHGFSADPAPPYRPDLRRTPGYPSLLAGAFLIFAAWRGEGAFLSGGLKPDLLLMSAGVATSVPLLLFAAAARRLRLATIGFLQYITPTMHFLLAVMVYGEPFTPAHLASFLCIWAGLVCYSWDAWRALSAQRMLRN